VTTLQLLDLLLAKAPELREAGVLELGIEGLTVKLAPAVPASIDVVGDDTDDSKETNMWNDPITFGRRRGTPGRPMRTDPNK
jgi:hypothetical protein